MIYSKYLAYDNENNNALKYDDEQFTIYFSNKKKQNTYEKKITCQRQSESE